MADFPYCSNRLKRLFRNLSLKYKFFGMFFINTLMLLTAFFLCFFICTKSYNKILYKTVAGNLSYSSDTISAAMNNIETLSSMILSDDTIQKSLTVFSDTADPVIRYNAEQELNRTLFSYYDTFRTQGISYIAVNGNKTTTCTNWYQYNLVSADFLEQMKQTAHSGNGSVKWIWESGNQDGLFLTRDIRQIKNFSLDSLGQLMIHVDIDEIVSSANTAATQYENSYYVITNDNGSVIYSSKPLTQEESASIHRFNQKNYGPVSLQGHTYFAVNGTIPDYRWHYTTLIPFDTITQSLDISLITIFLILLAASGIIILLSHIFIRSLTMHFDALNYKMMEFSKNELSIPQTAYCYQERQDEIGKLHQQFDAMMMRIQSLINTNYVNELLRKDAQLKALEAQINPHFLYNTLESINWRAKINNNQDISQMAESLGTLLRATLSNKKSLVTLACELELVRCYITIQKLRFEDELECQFTTESGLENALIPPLTIQPLIENAIHYGMEEMEEICHVFIFIKKCDSRLVIKVQNDGSVIDEHLLERLESKEIHPNGFGIGLLNINKRIQLLFGKECGLHFSNENGLATVTLIFTYKTEESQFC